MLDVGNTHKRRTTRDKTHGSLINSALRVIQVLKHIAKDNVVKTIHRQCSLEFIIFSPLSQEIKIPMETYIKHISSVLKLIGLELDPNVMNIRQSSANSTRKSSRSTTELTNPFSRRLYRIH